MMLVAGSQADRAEKNKITILKISDVQKTQISAGEYRLFLPLGFVFLSRILLIDSDESEDEDDHEDEDPTLEHINVNHMGGVNRIRSMPQEPGIVATMADTSKAHIFDLTRVVRSMMTKGPRVQPPNKPAYTFKGHREEGYAVDWSGVTTGQLATGDCAGGIYIWNNAGGGAGGTLASSWKVSKAYLGHEGSVEDLQWSPTEATVFGSSSVDRTVRIWDTRGKSGPQITVNAHENDVNVISWNKNVNYLLASGCDDGSFKVNTRS
jgi:ribosome assembly protein RRB1